MNFKKEMLDKLDAYKNVIYVAERLRLYVDIIVGISDKSSCSQSKNDFYFYIKDSLDEKDKMLILYYLFHSKPKHFHFIFFSTKKKLFFKKKKIN